MCYCQRFQQGLLAATFDSKFHLSFDVGVLNSFKEEVFTISESWFRFVARVSSRVIFAFDICGSILEYISAIGCNVCACASVVLPASLFITAALRWPLICSIL